MMTEPAFDQLRTKEQLGYIVHTASFKLGKTVSLRIIVQSNSRRPCYLDKQVETFLAQYRTVLETLTAEELNDNIQAVVEKLLEKPKNLDKETMRYWDEITSGSHLFSRRQREADFLRSSVSLEDLKKFFDRYLVPSSSHRRKFSSQFFGTGHKPCTPAEVINEGVEEGDSPVVSPHSVVLIKDYIDFKRKCSLLPVKSNPPFASLQKK